MAFAPEAARAFWEDTMTLLKQLYRMLKMTRRVGGWRAAGRLIQRAPQQLALFQRLLMDVRVPAVAKAALLAGVVYAVSPLDFIPDWIPGLGQLDDIGVALMAVNFFLAQVPARVLAEHKQALGLADEFPAS